MVRDPVGSIENDNFIAQGCGAAQDIHFESNQFPYRFNGHQSQPRDQGQPRPGRRKAESKV